MKHKSRSTLARVNCSHFFKVGGQKVGRSSAKLLRLLAGWMSACFVWSSAAAVRAEWPEFRGPSGQGLVAKELPTHWSDRQNVAWRCELPGEGWSSPVVWQDRIYQTAAIATDEDGFQLALLIVDAKLGRLEPPIALFEQGPKAPRIHRKNSHASPTPIIHGEHIYVHFGHQGTACCRLDGTVVWKNTDLSYPPVHGNGGSPVITNDKIVFSRDGGNISQVTALDSKTGRLAWECERNVSASKSFSFCTPLLIRHQGRAQLVIPGSDVVQSLDPDSGKEWWRVEYTGYSVVPRPIYHSGLVYVTTGYDNAQLLAIDPAGDGNVTESHVRWRFNSAVPNTPSLVAWKSQVIMISDKGIVTGLDAETGELIWKKRIGGDFSASPLLANDRLYLMSEAGVCSVLDLSSKPPVVIASNDLQERSLASPAVLGNDLLIRTAQALYRIAQ